MEKLNNIPALRFPEFQENWESKKLGDIAEKVNSGKTPLGGQEVYVENGILFIRSQNVLDNKLSFDNSTFITEKINNTMKNSVVIANDILLNITGASLGRSCVVPKNFNTGNVNQHVCIIRLNKENEPAFVQPIFASEKGQNIFISLQTGGGREGLNFQSIKGISLAFPTLPEQQKIATFLTAVDEKLQALKQKKSLLEQYKKGVMQQIFSQKLRFKDKNGNDFADWEEKKVKEIFILTRGNVLSMTLVSEIQDNNNYYPVYSSQTKKNGLSGYYNKFLFEDCITWTTDGAGAGDVNFRKGKFYCTNVCGVLKSDKGYANVFIAEILNSISRKYVSYVGNPKLMNNVMAEISISIPTSIEEQTKIADFLSAIDDKINHCQSQIVNTEVWKKGLLQQMFV
jgi:type I restriction enzyme S subunit